MQPQPQPPHVASVSIHVAPLHMCYRTADSLPHSGQFIFERFLLCKILYRDSIFTCFFLKSIRMFLCVNEQFTWLYISAWEDICIVTRPSLNGSQPAVLEIPTNRQQRNNRVALPPKTERGIHKASFSARVAVTECQPSGSVHRQMT